MELLNTITQSLITAISRIRFENGKSPSVVRRFLIDQLRYNDNTANPVRPLSLPFWPCSLNTKTQYSDAFYICTVISAAASASLSTAAPERGELLPTEVRTEHNAEDEQLLKLTLAEVDRYRSMDRLIPSTHNVVTVSALEVRILYSDSTHTLDLTFSVLHASWRSESRAQQLSYLLPAYQVRAFLLLKTFC